MSKDQAQNIPESGTVTVACKLPHGLILQLHEMVETQEPVMGGGFRSFKIARAVGEQVRIRGNAIPFGKIPNYEIKSGFALTPNVNAQFFRRWMKDNQDHDVVKNNLIFAFEKTDSVVSKAKELKDELSGLEPLDMSKVTRNGKEMTADLRIPRPNSRNLSPIENAEVE